MSAPVETPTPRQLWQAVEGVHAVVVGDRTVDEMMASFLRRDTKHERD